MGGTNLDRPYVRPVRNYPDSKWRSTFRAHTRRTPTPSKEPGVDYYCPLGTELVSIGDGVVAEVGGSIHAPAGRYVKVNLFDGRSFRLLHLGPRHSLIPVGREVGKSQPLAISGASGYGSEFFGAASASNQVMLANTGGPHVHATLFPTHAYNNFIGLLDLELYVESESLMPALNDDEQREMLNAIRNIFAGLYIGGPSTADGGPLMQTIARHGQAIGRIDAAVAPIQRTVNGELTATALNQELADVKTLLLELAGKPAGELTVDETALAVQLAPLLAPLLSDHLSTLDDDEVERLAIAANDEADRRSRMRLERDDNPAT